MEKTEIKPMLKDYTMMIHLSMSTYHQAKHTGIIVWEGSELNGKTLCIETITPKTKRGNFGKPKETIYLNEKDSPMFKSMAAFMKHYSTNQLNQQP